MSSIDRDALREAMRPAPYQPTMSVGVSLYDLAAPCIETIRGDANHVAVRVGCSGGDLRVACFTPATLRRFAEVCAEAADELEQARERLAEAEQVAS